MKKIRRNYDASLVYLRTLQTLNELKNAAQNNIKHPNDKSPKTKHSGIRPN